MRIKSNFVITDNGPSGVTGNFNPYFNGVFRELTIENCLKFSEVTQEVDLDDITNLCEEVEETRQLENYQLTEADVEMAILNLKRIFICARLKYNLKC